MPPCEWKGELVAVTPQTNVTLAELAGLMRGCDDFVICGHVSPDGDCFGSQLALYHALTAMGKRAACVLVRDEEPAASLAFMPGMGLMVPAASYDGACKTFVGVDVPTRERIGEDACALLDRADVSITIDHHASAVAMCQHVYVDPDAAAAAMLVWDLAKLLVDEPPADCALCAYVGLVTDTGGFRFQNSDSRAFDVAAELVAYGVDPAMVATNVFQNRSMASLKLEALTIDRMQLLGDGRASLSWVSEDDLARFGADKADVEPLVDIVRALDGVLVACMLRDQDGQVRGNLRSKDDTDVSALARELGGGGHKAAAGFTLDMPMSEAVEFMKPRLAALFG